MSDAASTPSTDSSPYGGPSAPSVGSPEPQAGPRTGLQAVARVRTRHLQEAKAAGERFSMLTSYDAMTAGVFDEAGIDVLLVGDSAGSTVFGQATTLSVTLEQMIMLTAAVSSAARRALVVADVPFGTYEESPQQAVRTCVRLLKEGGAHAVKIEGGPELAEHIRAVVRTGIPVMGHVGFTPQSEHALGGYRIQGRGEQAQQVIDDARAIEAVGAFAVLLEMVPAEVGARTEAALTVPTVGIGAGADTTGQVLVWQDALGLNGGRVARFVRQYADLRSVMAEAVGRYAQEVRDGSFPAPEHTY